jgi:hypothetical protein
MNVRLLRTLNLSFGIAMILAVNAVGSLPKFYKGVQHQVGPELVSVYSPEGNRHEILTRIQTHGMSGTGFIDTGQSVQVYLRNGYKDDEILYYPRWTFLIAMCMVVNHLALTLILSMSQSKAESPTEG